VVLSASRVVPENDDCIFAVIVGQCCVLHFLQGQSRKWRMLAAAVTIHPSAVDQTNVLIESKAHPLEAVRPNAGLNPRIREVLEVNGSDFR